jgi:sodium-dependent phosphate cotransporter
VTALLASMTGTPQALTVALVHLMFNLSGILIIYPIPWLRRIPIRLAKGLAAATAKRRIYAVLYMIGVFFVLPFIFVLLDKLIRGA